MIEHLAHDSVSLWLVLMVVTSYFTGQAVFRLMQPRFTSSVSLRLSFLVCSMLALGLPIVIAALLSGASTSIVLHWCLWAFLNSVIQFATGSIESAALNRWPTIDLHGGGNAIAAWRHLCDLVILIALL